MGPDPLAYWPDDRRGLTESRLSLGSAALPRWGELALVAGYLSCLGAFVFGSHIADGGLYVDDRWFHSLYESGSGYLSGVGRILDSGGFGFRPLLAAQMGLTYEVFGLESAPLLAWGLALAVTASVGFYALLRNLRVEWLHAGAIASLALISPAADSTKLWATTGNNNMAVALYFAGAIAVVRGFAASGRRAVVLHGLGIILYAASVLLYEAAAVAMLGSVVLYRFCVSWGPALRRWIADVFLVGTLLALNAAITDRTIHAFTSWPSIALTDAQDAMRLVLSAGLPYGSTALLTPILVLSVLAVVSAFGVKGWRAEPAVREQVRRWWSVGVLGALGMVAGCLMLVPSGWSPLGLGIDGRYSVFFVFGLVTVLYSAVIVAGTLALRSLERWHQLSIAVTLVLAIALGVAYANRVNVDKPRWAAAAKTQQVELERLGAALPYVPSGSTVYVVGHKQAAAPGLPGLVWWDLYGAGHLMWGPSVKAVLLPPGTPLECDPRAIGPKLKTSPASGSNLGWNEVVSGTYLLGDDSYDTGGVYRESYVVDVRTEAVARVADADACRRIPKIARGS